MCVSFLGLLEQSAAAGWLSRPLFSLWRQQAPCAGLCGAGGESVRFICLAVVVATIPDAPGLQMHHPDLCLCLHVALPFVGLAFLALTRTPSIRSKAPDLQYEAILT